jgi:23S rRNA (guanosine2251-2'-O)-methyltransferase
MIQQSKFDEKLSTLLKLCDSVKVNWVDEVKRSLLLTQIFSELKDLEKFKKEDSAKSLAKLCRLNTEKFQKEQVDHIITALERALSHPKAIEEFDLSTQDRPKKETSPFDVVVVLDNLRSAHNVGSILRSAEGFNLKKIYFTGYTPTPENEKVLKTGMGSHDRMDWESNKNPIQLIEELKTLNYKCYGIETSSKATSVNATNFNTPLALFFGNERFGLSKDILSSMDELIRIPLYGQKNSLNVSVCAGVIFNQVVHCCL